MRDEKQGAVPSQAAQRDEELVRKLRARRRNEELLIRARSGQDGRERQEEAQRVEQDKEAWDATIAHIRELQQRDGYEFD